MITTDLSVLSLQLAEVMHARQTILPKRLGAPGPDATQLEAIWSSAATAPDHGQLRPWRFVVVPEQARSRLADVFAQALRERDATASPAQLAQAAEKAHRAPLLLLAVLDGAVGTSGVDVLERTISLGCAIQNMLLMATALGFGSALTSGKALKAEGLRSLFQLGPDEQAVCFVSMGTVLSRKPARVRPVPADFVRTL
jgi:nitroreductase